MLYLRQSSNSTDGELTIPKTAARACKPGQRKRARSEKTKKKSKKKAKTPRRGRGSTLRSLFLCGGFYVLFIHLLIIIKYTSIYTDYLLQKEMTNISVCSFHKQGRKHAIVIFCVAKSSTQIKLVIHPIK
jgi:hypothetical protein